MFGAYIRAVLNVGVAVLVAALLQFIIPFFMPFMGDEESLMYRSLDTLADNALMIMLIAIAAGLIARAAVERSPRGRI